MAKRNINQPKNIKHHCVNILTLNPILFLFVLNQQIIPINIIFDGNSNLSLLLVSGLIMLILGSFIIKIYRDKETLKKNLETSEKRYKEFIENTSALMLKINKLGEIKYINSNSLYYFGKSPDICVGLNFYDFIGNEDREFVINHINNLFIENTDNITIESKIVNDNSTSYYIQWNIHIIDNVLSELVEFIIDGRDISESKFNEELIKLQHEISYKISTCQNIKTAFQILLDGILSIKGIDGGGIYQVDDNCNIDLIVYEGLSQQFCEKIMHYSNDTPQAKIVKLGKPIYSQYQNVLLEAMDDVRIKEGLKAFALIPLMHHGKPIACMNFMSRTFNIFPENIKDTLDTIASQIGSILSQLITEIELKDSEKRLRSVLSAMVDYVFEFDEDNRFTFYHKPENEPLYLLPEMFLGKIYSDVLPLEVSDKLSQALIMCEKGESSEFDYSLDMDNEIKWFSAKISPKYEDGVYKGSLAVSRDITERKQIELNLSKTKALLMASIEQSPAGIIIVDAKTGNVQIVNSAVLSIYGQRPDIFNNIYSNSIKLEEQLYHWDWTPLSPDEIPLVKAIRENKISQNIKIAIRDKDGNSHYLFGNSAPIYDDDGNLIAGIVVFNDITEYRKVEEKYRYLFDNLPIGIFRTTLSGEIIEANPGLLKYAGCTSLDESKSYFSDLKNMFYVNPEDRDKHIENLSKYGINENQESKVRDKYGKEFWISISSKLDKENGIIEGFIFDITKLKNTENTLRESDYFLRKAQEISHIGHFKYNPKTDLVEGSDELFKIFNINRGDVYITDFFNTIHPDFRSSIVELVTSSMKNCTGFEVETTLLLEENNVKYVKAIGVPIFDSGNIIELITGTVQDITKEKLIEEALRDSEETYRNLFNNSPIGIFRTSLEGKIINLNAESLKILGCDSLQEAQEHFYDLGRTWYVDPEDRRKFLSSLKEQNIVEEFECKVRRKNNEDIWVAINGIIRENEKTIDGWVLNISKRKKAEEALKESEERYRNIIEQNPIGMHSFDLNPEDQLIFVGTNLSADTILGVDNKLNYGKTIEEISPQLTQTELPKVFKKLAKEGGLWKHEVEYHRGPVNGIYEIYAFQTSQNKMVVCFFDITERRNIETKLIKSEEKYRNLFNHSTLGITQTNIKGEILEMNPEALRQFGSTSLEEIKNECHNTASNLYAKPEDRSFFLSLLKEHKIVRELEMKFVKINGEHYWSSMNAVLRDDNLIDVWTIDITKRKKVDDELKRSEEKYRNLFEHSPLGIFRTSIKGQLLEGNAQLLKISGCETFQEAKDYFINLSDSWYVNPKDREEIIKELNVIGYIDAFEYKARNKKNQEIWIISSFKLDKEKGIIDGFFYDISSRKKAEEELISSEEKYRNLIDFSPIGIIQTSIDGKILALNPEALTLLGCENVEEAISHFYNLKDTWYVEPNDRDIFLSRIKENSTGEIVCKVRKKNGTEIWVDIYGKLRSDGKIIDAWLVDVTSRKKMEEEIKQSEEKYRILVDNAPVGVGLVKGDEVVYCNNSYINTLGYENLDDLKSVPLMNTIAPEDRPMIRERMKKYSTDEKLYPIVLKALRKDNAIRNVQMSGNNVIINGQIYRQTIMMDITDRIKAEDELKQSEEKYRSLVDNIFVGVSITDGDYYTYVNNSQLNILGYDSVEELLSIPLSNLIVPEQQDIHFDRLKKYSLGTEVPSTIFRVLRKDGSIRIVNVSGDNIVINGKQYRQNVMMDITEKVKAEEELQWNLSLLKSTMEATVDGILVVDKLGKKISTFNKSFIEIWKIPEEIKSMPDKFIFRYMLEQLKNSNLFLNEIKYLSEEPDKDSYGTMEFNDGRLFEKYSKPQRINDEIVGRVWSFRDVTEEKRAKEKLKQSIEALKSSNKELEQFAYIASHDLQEPLRMVTSYMNLLEEE